MKLEYHQHALDFLGIEPRVSNSVVEQIEQCERECGRKLPAAVREWYSLDGTDGRLDDVNLDNRAESLTDFLAHFLKAVEEKKDLAYFYGAYAANTGCSILIPLDGSDDPMLVECGNFDHADVLPFSQFIRVIVWQKHLYSSPFIFSCDFKDEFYPREAELGPKQLSYLADNFRQFPPNVEQSSWKKFGDCEDWEFRFSQPGQQVELKSINDPRTDTRRGTFHLTAVTVDKLLELYDLFSYHDRYLRVGDIQFEEVRDVFSHRFPQIKLQPERARTI